MRIVKVKNNQDVADTYCSQELQPGQEYTIETNAELERFAEDPKVYLHVCIQDGDAAPKLLVLNSEGALEPGISAHNWLTGDLTQTVVLSGPAEMTPLSPKNDQQLLPHGMKKFKFNSKNYVGNITLTKDSGRVFSYTNESFDPQEGDYVLYDEVTYHCEIEEVDLVNKKITLSDGEYCGCHDGIDAVDGTYVLSTPFKYYVKVPNIDNNEFYRELVPGFSLPAACFYGYTCTRIKNNAEDDFIELGVECVDGIPLYEGAWIIPPGGWSVDYDYSWVDTLLVQPTVTVHLVDGAPGYLPSGFYLRVKYFHTIVSEVDNWISLKLDVIFAKKDAE